MSRWLPRAIRHLRRLATLLPELSAPQRLFERLDHATFRARLDPTGHGAGDGGRNVPPPSATTPAPFERDATREVMEHVDDTRAIVQRLLDMHATSGVEPQAALIGAHAQLDRLCSSLIFLAAHLRNVFGRADRDVTAHAAELEAFRAREGITRPAREPDAQLLRMAKMLAMVFIETVANGALFGQNLRLGYLGGVTYAALLSVVNVGVAFLFGRMLIPYAHSARLLLKAWGVFCFAAFLALAVLINAAIANYRSALGIDPGTAGEIAVTRVLTAPFALTHLSDWLLLLLGLTFALLACREGYRFGDPHPQYAELALRLRQREEDFDDLVEDAVTRAEGVRDEGIAALESGVASVVLASTQAQVSRARSAEIARQWNEYVLQAQGILDSMVGEYRAANTSARSDPIPPSFAVRLALPTPELSIPAMDAWNAHLALQELDARRKELNRLFAAAVPVTTDSKERGRDVPRTQTPAA